MPACEITKITQAAAVIMKQHDGRITRLRLLKLLYIAYRECLREALQPITYDKAVAMDHGPVLSKTYDLIKGSDWESSEWDKAIKQSGPREMQLVNDPGVSKLSKREISKLIEVCERFLLENDWDVAEYTHKFPEWEKNRPEPKRRKPISFNDRMDALGFGNEERSRIIADHKEDLAIEQLLASARQ